VARLSEGAFGHSYVSYLEKGTAPWAKVSLTVLKGFARAFRMSVEDLVDYVDGRGEVSPTGERLVSGRRVPVFDLVSGGDGLDGGVVIDYADIPMEWKGEFVAYEVEGDSMAPSIPAGSRVITKKTDVVRPGQLIVAYVPEHGMVAKRYAYNEPDGLVVLTSDNPEHPPIFTREMTPIGVIVEVRTIPR
jgi:repressor LexA